MFFIIKDTTASYINSSRAINTIMQRLVSPPPPVSAFITLNMLFGTLKAFVIFPIRGNKPELKGFVLKALTI